MKTSIMACVVVSAAISMLVADNGVAYPQETCLEDGCLPWADAQGGGSVCDFDYEITGYTWGACWCFGEQCLVEDSNCLFAARFDIDRISSDAKSFCVQINGGQATCTNFGAAQWTFSVEVLATGCGNGEIAYWEQWDKPCVPGAPGAPATCPTVAGGAMSQCQGWGRVQCNPCNSEFSCP